MDRIRPKSRVATARLAAVLAIVLVGASLGVIKLTRPAEAATPGSLAGTWQAALLWSGSGCGPMSGLLIFTLDSTGSTNTAQLTTHSAGCGNATSTQTFVVNTLNDNGSGTANLSCGTGCGWELIIQVDQKKTIFNLVDVDPNNPGNFVEGTAIKRTTATHH